MPHQLTQCASPKRVPERAHEVLLRRDGAPTGPGRVTGLDGDGDGVGVPLFWTVSREPARLPWSCGE